MDKKATFLCYPTKILCDPPAMDNLCLLISQLLPSIKSFAFTVDSVRQIVIVSRFPMMKQQKSAGLIKSGANPVPTVPVYAR